MVADVVALVQVVVLCFDGPFLVRVQLHAIAELVQVVILIGHAYIDILKFLFQKSDGLFLILEFCEIELWRDHFD